MNINNTVIRSLGLLFLFSISISFGLKAEEVKPIDIKKVALNAFSYYSGKSLSEFKIVQEIPVDYQDTALLYIYNFENGFIIVAADNVSEPILGFGTDSKFDFEDMPPALHYLLECYQEEILYVKRQKQRGSQESNAKWEEYLSPNPNKTLYTPATWLIETKWNQSGGAASGSTVGYNYYCPVSAQGKTLVGCGGVALAQILNFWLCRVHPQGPPVDYTPPGLSPIYINLANQTYSWGAMLPNQANTSNALLLYHCAAAIKSEFGTIMSSGTTSYPSTFPYYLNRNFGFNGNHRMKDNYNSQDWINLLKTNIDNRRPVIYAGQKATGGGHGWIVDGYNSNNFFHCNWGWGGSSDGWFNLTNLTGNVAYTNYQSAVVNIYPTYYTNLSLRNTTITSNTYTEQTIIVENATIQNNADVILKADCATEIYGPFDVPLGATLEVK